MTPGELATALETPPSRAASLPVVVGFDAFVDEVVQVVGTRTAPDAYDLVFTDQTMPRMTGDELLAALRAAGIGTPVILCSGHTDAVGRRAVAAQIAIFLAKPAGPDAILAALARALEG